MTVKNGQLPKGWREIQLGEFMEFKNGLNTRKENYGSGVKFVNVMDVFSHNYLYANDVIGSVQVTKKQLVDYSVKYGDVLFNRTSETFEEIAMSSVYLDKKEIIFGGFVIRGRQKSNILIPEYSAYCFQAHTVRRELIRRGQGAVRANIGQKDLSKIPMVIPPVNEQKTIASLLEKWDTAIEKTEALIEAKEKRFKWLVKLLISKIHNSKYGRVSSITKEVSNRNQGGAVERVLSVTNHSGFVLPEDQFEHRVASADLSNYKIVSHGQYAYNPSRINVGSIARLDDWDVGVLSPMYVVFKLDKKKVNSDYFLHWLSLEETRQRIKSSAQGSVRETVSFGNFGAIPVPLPSLEVQTHIAKTLNVAKGEIYLLRQLAEQYRTQKRGLMQKLLTGKWRLKID